MISRSRQFIGVDIGGTAIKVGRFDQNGCLLANIERLTPRPSMPGAVTMELCEAIDKVDPDCLAAFVGVGLPGPMDSAGRVARICINLPGWVDVPLADWLESRLNRQVTLGNDGNCALLAEAWQGAARGFTDVLLLTLGTGVGGGVMLGGKLFTGRNGAAAEPGLIGIDPNGPNCKSGNQGSLEQFASVSGLKLFSDIDAEQLNKLASLGDQRALEAWSNYGHMLGVGISSLVYVFTPQLVLIGGGLSKAAVHFLPSVRKEVELRVQAVSRGDLSIKTCALGNGAGRLGAARLAIECFTSSVITPRREDN